MMRVSRRKNAALAFVCACAAFASRSEAQASDPHVAQERDRISAQLEECVTRNVDQYERRSPGPKGGGAVLVAQHGQTLLSRGYGYADMEWRVPNTPQTRFRVMSLTKTFTATAIMILAQQGKLRLDDAICSYIDSCPKFWLPVTLRQLLSHTSGIDDVTCQNARGEPCVPEYAARFKQAWPNDSEFLAPLSHDDAIDLFAVAPLKFTPGTGFRYSNPGYYLLGLAIERASGYSYEHALRTLIFDPLQMNDSGVYRNDRIVERLAEGYAPTGDAGRPGRSRYFDFSWFYAAGAMYSSVEDLARFDRAVRAGKLLPKETWRLMMTAVPPASGYGLGWEIITEPERKVGHLGAGGPGFVAEFWQYPADGLTIVSLTNYGWGMELVPQFRAIIAAKGEAGADILDSCAQ